jgi:hypothetical protein
MLNINPETMEFGEWRLLVKQVLTEMEPENIKEMDKYTVGWESYERARTWDNRNNRTDNLAVLALAHNWRINKSVPFPFSDAEREASKQWLAENWKEPHLPDEFFNRHYYENDYEKDWVWLED